MRRRIDTRRGLVMALVAGGMLAAATPGYGATQVNLFRTSQQPPTLLAGAVNGRAVTVKRVFPLRSTTLDSWTLVPVPGHAIRDPMYTIRNRATGGCMHVNANFDATPVYVSNTCRVFADPGGDIYANWRFYTASGIGPLRAPQPPEGVDSPPYQIRNELTKKCLTVSYSRYEVGTQLRVFTCSRIPSRLWIARVFDA